MESELEERRHPQLAGLQLELLEAANLHLREVEVQNSPYGSPRSSARAFSAFARDSRGSSLPRPPGERTAPRRRRRTRSRAGSPLRLARSRRRTPLSVRVRGAGEVARCERGVSARRTRGAGHPRRRRRSRRARPSARGERADRPEPLAPWRHATRADPLPLRPRANRGRGTPRTNATPHGRSARRAFEVRDSSSDDTAGGWSVMRLCQSCVGERILRPGPSR